MAILAMFFEIWTANLFCPSFTLILRGKPNWELIGPNLTILASKATKMAMSQNAFFAKCQSPKSLLLLHFSIYLSETFKICVNVDFANYLKSGILIQVSRKIWSPKSKNYRVSSISFFKVLGCWPIFCSEAVLCA